MTPDTCTLIIMSRTYNRKQLKRWHLPNGKKYVYAVFWTRITNETNELTMKFTEDSYGLQLHRADF